MEKYTTEQRNKAIMLYLGCFYAPKAFGEMCIEIPEDSFLMDFYSQRTPTYTANPEKPRGTSVHYLHPHELLFESSLDWIMPVAERIGAYTVGGGTELHLTTNGVNSSAWFGQFRKHNITAKRPSEAVFMAVSEFCIDWCKGLDITIK